ncbi:prepilin peptidase [Saccharothrix sp.]|uniref:prepilin peptidase n=1 Tax=Saccharothrix sp. TaxID=1873460 RepID=UPI002811A1D8|nr:prepilin peptidase [Saccharothrix sp.]
MVVTSGLVALVGYRFAGSPELPAMCWFAAIGVRLIQLDLVSRRLPHLHVGAMVLGGLPLLTRAALVEDDLGGLLRGLTTASVLFIAMHLAVSRGGIGGGDANLLAAVGLYLGKAGWEQLVHGLAAAVALAGCAALALVTLRRVSSRDPIAVGPAIFGGALIALLP